MQLFYFLYHLIFLQKSLLEIRLLRAELTAPTPYIVYVPFENKSHWSTLELTFEEGCVSICNHDPLGHSGEFSDALWAAITQVLSSINFEGDIQEVHSKLEQR